MPNNLPLDDTHTLYLRTPDGEEYGPADIQTIRTWCQEGRIGPDQVASSNRQDWTPVTEIPELEFDWLLILADGTEAGPFHIAILEEQAREGNLPEGSYLRNRHTGEERPAETSDSADEPLLLPAAPTQEPPPIDHEEEAESVEIPSIPPTPTAEPPDDVPPPQDDQEQDDDIPLSIRLETVTQHATEAREQLSETRANLQAIRRDYTLLQDQNQHLQDTLATTEAERDAAEENLLVLQNQCAQNEAELDNLRAQLSQLQEQYEKIQLENQRQFETIDDLRASALTAEQKWKRELSVLQSEVEGKNRVLEDVASAIAQDPHVTPRTVEHPPKQQFPFNEQLRAATISAAEEQTETTPTRASRANPPPPVTTPPPRTTRTTKRTTLVAIILLILALTGWAIVSRINQRHTDSPRTTQPNTTENSTNAMAPLDPESEGNLILQPEQIRDNAQRNQTATIQNWPQIELQRASITQEDNAMQIIFDYGLFPSNTTLREEAREDLRNLARQLRNRIHDFSIIVEGHTDTVPVQPGDERIIDSFSLGMERAKAVKFFLSDEGNLPAGRIHTASAGQASPPYPNDTSANRARNRTVTISIIP